MKKLTYEFIKEQIEKEGYKLLSKKYINNKKKLKTICPLNHIYNPTWNDFQQGARCKICFYENHGKENKFTYEYVKEYFEQKGYKLLSKKYIRSDMKLNVICPKGHLFHPNFHNFKNGSRCFYCNNKEKSKKQKHTYKYIKEQIEKEGYKLLSKEYINNHIKLNVKCDKGHEYTVTWNDFQQGARCKICSKKIFSKKMIYSYNYIKNKIEKKDCKLLSKEYINSKEKINILCKNNHEYWIRWNDIQQGHECPFCNPKYSKPEKEIVDYLKSLNINVIENDRSIIGPLELDIIIPEHKLAIEYCGLYWHSEANKDKNYHLNKLQKTNEAGYRLITIFEDEWIYKQDIVKNRLRYFLNLNTERIYARKCEIREITKDEAEKFVNNYHIQGFANASIYLGAFYDIKAFGMKISKLVSVNTFIKRDNIYELNRFCVNTSIIGIASKFIKYFQRNYEWNKIITFADRRWSEGDLYEKIGFTKDKILRPDYSYFKSKDRIRYHKFGFRHAGMKTKLENYNPNLSEHKNMLNNNYLRIYDCGKIRYIIKKI